MDNFNIFRLNHPLRIFTSLWERDFKFGPSWIAPDCIDRIRHPSSSSICIGCRLAYFCLHSPLRRYIQISINNTRTWMSVNNWRIIVIAGFVNSFLSWKVFMPLSRLCYAAFLVNLNLIKVYSVHQDNPLYYNEGQIAVFLIGLVNVVFFLSFILSLLVEVPFLNLEQLIFAQRPKTDSSFCPPTDGNNEKYTHFNNPSDRVNIWH